MSDITFITSFFSVRTKENNNNWEGHFPTDDHYLNSAKKLLNLPINLVFFTESKFVDYFKKISNKSTSIESCEFDELELWSKYPIFQKNHDINLITNVDQTKFTPLYKLFTNCKIDFVKRVILKNPYNSKYFFWIDIRANDFIEISDEFYLSELQKDIIPNTVKINLMQLRPPSVVNDDKKFYYKGSWGIVAGGFWGGDLNSVMNFIDLCEKEILWCLDNELSPFDEQIYGAVVLNNLNKFDFYYGDYSEILYNVIYIRRNEYLAMSSLRLSFNINLHDITKKIGEKLLKSYELEYIDLYVDDLYSIYYFIYASSYWLGNISRAKEIIMNLFEKAKGDDELTNQIKLHKDFLISQLCYIDVPDCINFLKNL